MYTLDFARTREQRSFDENAISIRFICACATSKIFELIDRRGSVGQMTQQKLGPPSY